LVWGACWLSGDGNAALADDGPALLRALESSLVETIARAEQSVVSVTRVRPVQPGAAPAAGGLGEESSFVPHEFGSGVIFAGPDGTERYVLTAAHVVLGRRDWLARSPAPPGPEEIQVRLASRRQVAGQLMAADPRSDLAVLRLPLQEAGIPPDAAPALPLSADRPLRKGQIVITLGNPYAVARDGSASASIGIISNTSRRPWPPRGALVDPTEEELTIHHYGTLLTIDARLNLGTSGAAVVDLDGRLVGLATALAALEGYEKSAGYAVPIDAPALAIIDSLRQGFEVEYGFLGVQPGTADAALLESFRPLTEQAAAARIRRVVPGSPAERAGLQTGDVVLAVGGQPVYSDTDLIREVGWLGPDAAARLTVARPGEDALLEVVCRLGKWPVYDETLLVTTRERQPLVRGLRVDYPTARRRYLPANPLAAFPQGVAVTHVDPGSAAASAGLIEGDFIVRVAGEVVHTPAEFARRVSEHAGEVALELANGKTVSLSP
jgi:serine protease Do